MRDAYEEAGYTGQSMQAPSRLADHYRYAIDYLKHRASSHSEDDRLAQVDRVRRVAEFNISRILHGVSEWTAEGFRELPDEVLFCVQRLQVDTFVTKRGLERTRVKIWPKDGLKAEDILAKLQGHYAAQKIESVETAALDPRERMLDAIRRRRAAQQESDGDGKP